MKKKVILSLGSLLFALALMFSVQKSEYNSISSILEWNFVEQTAEASDCPNGCLVQIGGGCFCVYWYPYNEEKVWPLD